jgi:predicted DNA-binding transcriptional regulator AlpA
MIDRTALDAAIATAEAPELLALAGELQGRAWSRLSAPHAAMDADWPASVSQERNLSATEAAERLGMSRDWLYRNAARLPFAVRIGSRVLFSAQGLERWNRSRVTR